MKELSLNILDIAQNSISAGAGLVEIDIREDAPDDRLTITIADDGHGMTPEFLARVADPFTTTRTTRKVGMGLALLKEAAELTGGDFAVDSTPGQGTRVNASFGLSHIDRAPLGDIAGTITALISGAPQCDFVYRHFKGEGQCGVDTRELRQILEGVPLNQPEIILWIRDYVLEQERNLDEGATS